MGSRTNAGTGTCEVSCARRQRYRIDRRSMAAVFVHGVPETYRIWDGVRAQLSRDDTTALALPGFDAPLPDHFEATKEQYAAWIVRELEALGAHDTPVDLIGHDWGSLLVQRVASTR